jgi:membrane protease YdiL (CAAX protease family)
MPPPLPPPPPRRPTPSTLIAWLVILTSAGSIIATTALEKSAQPAGRKSTEDLSFRISARYAIGAHHVLSLLAQPGADAGQADWLLASVDEAASDRDQKVRAAIAAGDIAGAEAARLRLAKLPDDVRRAADVAALQKLYAGEEALTAEERQVLISRHGWFGALALSQGGSGSDGTRSAVLWPAARAFVLVIVAMFAGLAALAAGVALLAAGVLRWADGRMLPSYRPPDGPTGPFLEAFAVYLAAMVGLSALVHLVMGQRLIGAWFVLVTLPFVALWPLLRGIGRTDWRAGLGWHAGRGLWREAGAGLVGYLAGLPVLGAGAVLTLFLQRFSGSDTAHPIVNELAESNPWRVMRLFMLAAAWAPLVEETMFRGALYHHLRGRLRWPAAAALVAVLFAAVHPQGWAAIPVLGAIGFSLAAIREWRGSVVASAVAHAINNGVVTLFFYLLLG